MNLYQWDSSYLQRYSKGDIIVMAESVEKARLKAQGMFYELDREKYDYDYESFDVSLDEYEWERILDRLNTYRKDLSVEPELIGSGVLLVLGSE